MARIYHPAKADGRRLSGVATGNQNTHIGLKYLRDIMTGVCMHVCLCPFKSLLQRLIVSLSDLYPLNHKKNSNILTRYVVKQSDVTERLSIHTKYMLQEGREVPESCDRGSINILSG